MATALYRGKVHVGFLAAIVAASNAGGSGSVVGDTTTTMMWIDGVRPLQVLEAYIAAVPALLFFGVVAARQQHAFQPILKDAPAGLSVDKGRLGVVAAVLAAAIVVNVLGQSKQAAWLNQLPAIGLAVWATLLLFAASVRARLERAAVGDARRLFLFSLVPAASMMPIEALPAASWHVALGLGFVSAVFDNIPLTALALRQGGYDWGFLAYAVGFGGSMIWFGSSAGVALASQFPAGALGRGLGHLRLARRRRLRPRLLRAAARPRLAPRPGAIGAAIAPGRAGLLALRRLVGGRGALAQSRMRAWLGAARPRAGAAVARAAAHAGGAAARAVRAAAVDVPPPRTCPHRPVSRRCRSCPGRRRSCVRAGSPPSACRHRWATTAASRRRGPRRAGRASRRAGCLAVPCSILSSQGGRDATPRSGPDCSPERRAVSAECPWRSARPVPVRGGTRRRSPTSESVVPAGAGPAGCLAIDASGVRLRRKQGGVVSALIAPPATTAAAVGRGPRAAAPRALS